MILMMMVTCREGGTFFFLHYPLTTCFVLFCFLPLPFFLLLSQPYLPSNYSNEQLESEGEEEEEVRDWVDEWKDWKKWEGQMLLITVIFWCLFL